MDIATLGIRIDTTDLKDAQRALAGTAEAADDMATGVERAVDRAQDATGRFVKGATNTTSGLPAVKAPLAELPKAAAPIPGLFGKIGESFSKHQNTIRGTAQQLSQVAQSTQATGNFMSSLSIQLPDILGGLGTFGVLSGVAAGFLAPLVIDLFKGQDAAKGMADALDAFNDAASDYVDAADLAGQSAEELTERFGSQAEAIRETLARLAQLKQATAIDALRETAEEFDDAAKDIKRALATIDQGARGRVGSGAVERAQEVLAEIGVTEQQARALSKALLSLQLSTTTDSAIKSARELNSVLFEAFGSAQAIPEEFRAIAQSAAEFEVSAAEMAAANERVTVAAQAQGQAQEQAAAAVADQAAAATIAADEQSAAQEALARASESAAKATEAVTAAIEAASTSTQNLAKTEATIESINAKWADFTAAVDGFGAGIDAMIAHAQRGAEEIPAAMSGVVGAVEAIAEDAGRAGEYIGSEIVAGMVRGMDAAASRVAQRAARMADDAAAAVRKALEIRSPSRVFAEIGEQTAEGFAAGVEAGTPDAIDAAKRLAEGTIDAANSFRSGLTDIGVDLFTGFADSAESVLGRVRDLFFKTLRDMAAASAREKLTLNVSGGGGISGVLGSFSSGFSEVVGGFLSGGFKGAIGGATGAIGAAVGAFGKFAATIGAIAAPLAAVAGIASLFRTKTELLASGLELVIGKLDETGSGALDLSEALTLAARTFKSERKSNAFSASIDKDYGDAGPAGRALIDTAREMIANVVSAGEVLGIGADRFRDRLKYIQGAIVQIDLDGMSADQAAAEVQRRLNEFATGLIRYKGGVEAVDDALVQSLDRMSAAGEDSYATLLRVTQQFVTMSDVLADVTDKGLGIELAGAEAADALAKMFGGLDQFSTATAGYIQLFYSEAERAEIVARRLADELAEFGVALPRSRDAFRDLVEGLDLTTERGRELYAVLVGNAAAFDQILPALSRLSPALSAAFSAAEKLLGVSAQGLQAALSASEQAASKWLQVRDSLRGLVQDIDRTALGGRSNADQLDANRDALRRAIRGAGRGNINAAASIPGLARSVIEGFRATAGSGDEFRFRAAQVRAQVSGATSAATLEAGKEAVIADLYRQQIAALEELATELSSGDLTRKELRGLRERLRGLQGAVETARDMTFDKLQKQIDVTVKLAARADIPPALRAALEASTGRVKRTLDFIVGRDDLSPEQLFIAATEVSRMDKTLRFLVRDKALDDETKKIAAAEVSSLAKTLRFTVARDLPEDVKTLALARFGTYTAAVDAIVQADRMSDAAKRIALRQTGRYVAEVRAILGSDNTTQGIADLLTANATAARAATIAATVTGLSAEEREILTQKAARLRRTIAAAVEGISKLTDRERLFLTTGTDKLGSLTRSIVAKLDTSGMNKAGRELLSRLLNSADGKVTISGNVAVAFGDKFATAIGKDGPLWNALNDLRQAFRDEAAARRMDAKVSTLQSSLGDAVQLQQTRLGAARKAAADFQDLARSYGVSLLGADGGAARFDITADDPRGGIDFSSLSGARAEELKRDPRYSQFWNGLYNAGLIASADTIDRLRKQIRALGAVPSFMGGGYTGNGPRTGGADGRGGFWAMLHPRETVVDHTAPGGGAMVAELQALRVEIAQLRREQNQWNIAIERNTYDTAAKSRKWDVDGLPPERV